MTSLTVWDTNIIVEVSSAAPSADPVWVDISQWVIVPGGQSLETWLGRATELDSAEPGRFSLALNNRDGRFTAGNPLSPYPWWKQRRQLRIREQVGWRTFTLAQGYLEALGNITYTEVVGETDSDIVLNVTGIDRIGQAETSSRFVSNLGAHILGSPSAASLAVYYSLLDDPGSTGATPTYTDGRAASTLQWHRSGFKIASPYPDGGAVDFGAGDVFPGDDAAGPRFTYNESAGGSSGVDLDRSLFIDPEVQATTGNVLTVALWVWLSPADPNTLFDPYAFGVAGDANPSAAYLYRSAVAGTWAVDVAGGFPATWLGIGMPAGVAGYGMPMLAALRISPGGTSEIWINDTRATLSIAGPPPAIFAIDRVQYLASTANGTVAHLQIYSHGPTDGYTYEQHLAQLAIGRYGLERQTTGERIATIADYAGVPAGYRDVDDGTIAMAKASLAGKTAADAWREAVDTERGRLFTQDGRLVFQDRRRVYDV